MGPPASQAPTTAHREAYIHSLRIYPGGGSTPPTPIGGLGRAMDHGHNQTTESQELRNRAAEPPTPVNDGQPPSEPVDEPEPEPEPEPDVDMEPAG